MTIEYISHFDPTSTVLEKTVQHDFGVYDRFGRVLGARVSYTKKTYLPGPKVRPAHRAANGFEIPEWRTGSTDVQPGTYFAWYGTATRKGEPFGALQDVHLCKTAEERDAQVAKYLRDAGARARKRALQEATKKAARSAA
jgi:hypothetical protein